MTQPRTSEKQNAARHRRQHDDRAEVRFEQQHRAHRPDERERPHQRNRIGRQRGTIAREIAREVNHQCELGDFRRLHRERPDAYPAATPVDHMAEPRHQHHRGHQ